jgi:chromate transport protein ChrA
VNATDILTIGAILGFIMPPVIAFINQERWGSALKGVVAFVICLLASLGAEIWQDHELNWHDWRNLMIVVFSSAIFFYHQFFKPTTIAPAIESATSAK